MAESIGISESLNLSEIKKDLPRLLLVSEASLDNQRTGLNRTLVNLFEGYPADKFMVYSPKSTWKDYPTSPPLDQNVATFSDKFLPQINNRLGWLLNPIFQAIELQLIDWLPLANLQQISAFSPEIILICPNGSLGMIMGYKLIQHFDIPFLIYLMDDWLAVNHQHWFTGNVQSICSHILKEASGWLMISAQLERELVERYTVTPKRSLIVHNPVDLSNKQIPEFSCDSKETFRVIYAGSIWSMHYDAVAVVAQAIYELSRDGLNIELILHTDQGFWDFYQETWKKWRVTYGSFIPFKYLNQYLQNADILLVASSFLSENSYLTRSSVQTKLTDYMASGKPILACGPSYSACNQFLKEWNCGLVCETNEVSEIKAILLSCIQNMDELHIFAKKGFEVLQNNFDTKKVRANLYKFIQHQVVLITL